MEYKQYNTEKLQNIFDKEQNLEDWNKIMGVIVEKQDVLSKNNV